MRSSAMVKMHQAVLPQTCTLSGIDYYIHPQVQGYVDVPPAKTSNVLPVTVLPSDHESLNSKAFRDLIARFETEDDVFTQDFVSTAITVQTSGDYMYDIDIQLLTLKDCSSSLPPGPYFLLGEQLHQAWRLFPDFNDCFVTSFVPLDTRLSGNAEYGTIGVLDREGIWKSVAVPSRLFFRRSRDKPLAGKRIAVKDNFRVSGIKTTQMNRSFEATYGPDSESADFINKLNSLGAVIIGKTKMSAFASAEEPTDQFVDFHAPFNPRGDGYQTPAGSSSGSAAALASYDWLDLSIGTDTSGSIRYPAAICGIYGLRYSSQTVSLNEIYLCCNEFDAIGIMSRDTNSLYDLAASTVGQDVKDISQYPKRIIYPTDFLPYQEEPMQAVLEDFMQKLEQFLGVKREIFSIADRWEKCKPLEAEGKGLKDFLSKTGFYPFFYDGYNEYSRFREDHRKKFGRDAYVSPYMQWKWDTGKNVTLKQKEQSLREMEVYRKWFTENILASDSKTGSNATLMMSVSTYAPDYRDKINRDLSTSATAFNEAYTASLLRMPQIVVPVGQVPYHSRVTGRREWHPVTASMIGATNSELMLINVVRDTLSSANWSQVLAVGREAWQVGEGPRNVHEAFIAREVMTRKTPPSNGL